MIKTKQCGCTFDKYNSVIKYCDKHGMARALKKWGKVIDEL